MRFLGALLVFAACRQGGGMSAGPDATPDGAPVDTDASPSALGLWVTWRADPALPGDVDNKITVTDATFQMDRLQVIGDAGIDARTTHSKYLLAWNAQGRPPQERFPDAPVGVYSKILAVMTPGGLGDYAYEIHGTWMNGGSQPMPFEVRDRLTVSLSIDCQEDLPAAGSATLGIKVDLRDALNSVKWEDVVPANGVLELDSGPQLVQLRDRLKKAFKLDENDD
jgi:hypothetical protein